MAARKAMLAAQAERNALSRPTNWTRNARARKDSFHGPFYGLTNFCCKTAQLSETPRKPVLPHYPLKDTLCDTAKNCASPSL